MANHRSGHRSAGRSETKVTNGTTRGSGRRVLVVNDTQEILELFTELLGDLGYEVKLMSFAPNELTRIKQARPDLIIVDFVLGGVEKSGWQLLQKLKMDRETDAIPIVACTAAVGAVREQEGYLTEQGIVVLLKPFSMDQLHVAISKAFELRGSAIGTNREDGPGGGAASSASD